MDKQKQLDVIRKILAKRDSFKVCTHCSFEYMDLGCGDICPDCGLDITLSGLDLIYLEELSEKEQEEVDETLTFAEF